MTYKISLDPISGYSLIMRLYQNVTNVSEIRQKLISGDLKCCVIKPSLIIEPFQVVVAANKAVMSEKTTTKSIYTEILFNLSISTNISQSLLKFGIDDKDTDLLVVVLEKDEQSDVFKDIQGEESDISNLKELCDLRLIKKTYKISDDELKVCNIVDSIVSRIAIKDFVSV